MFHSIAHLKCSCVFKPPPLPQTAVLHLNSKCWPAFLIFELTWSWSSLVLCFIPAPSIHIKPNQRQVKRDLCGVDSHSRCGGHRTIARLRVTKIQILSRLEAPGFRFPASNTSRSLAATSMLEKLAALIMAALDDKRSGLLFEEFRIAL